MTGNGTYASVYSLGAAIVLTFMLGGGTVAGLWTDSLLQIVLLVAMFPVLISSNNRIEPRVLCFVAFCALIMLLQVVPLPQDTVAGLRPTVFATPQELTGNHAFISTFLTRTVGRIVYTFVLFALLLAMLKMSKNELYYLSLFFLIGLSLNIVASFFQYSASIPLSVSAGADYEMLAGTFANRNHLATLLFTSIPFCIYFIMEGRYRFWSGVALAGVLLIMLATGSRAGAAIAVLAVLSSFIVIGFEKTSAWRLLAAIGVNLVLLGFGIAGLVAQRGALPDVMRLEMAKTTLSAIRDNWLLGTGFGTFPQVYQVYESLQLLGVEFVNHAHNDYLEIALEGGVLAAVALLAYLLLFIGRLLSELDGFQKAAALSIFFILLHSMVDYPLRTMAIGVIFVYLNAILFHLDRSRLHHGSRQG